MNGRKLLGVTNASEPAALPVGNIAVGIRIGGPSWDLVVTMATKTVEITTQDLESGLGFAQQLLMSAAARSQSETGWSL